MLTIAIAQFRSELKGQLEKARRLMNDGHPIKETKAWISGLQHWFSESISKEDAAFLKEYRRATALKEEIISIPRGQEAEEASRRTEKKLRLQVQFLESLLARLNTPSENRPPHLPMEISSLKERISQNQLEEVLGELVSHLAQGGPPGIDHTVFLQRAQLMDIQQQHISGLLTDQEYQVARNRITKAVLEWLEGGE